MAVPMTGNSFNYNRTERRTRTVRPCWTRKVPGYDKAGETEPDRPRRADADGRQSPSAIRKPRRTATTATSSPGATPRCATIRRSGRLKRTAAPSRFDPIRCSPTSGAAKPTSAGANWKPPPVIFRPRRRAIPPPRGRSTSLATFAICSSGSRMPPTPTRDICDWTTARPRSATSSGWPAIGTATSTAPCLPSMPPFASTIGSTDAHYLRGLCLRDQRQLTAARHALERAVALSPGSIPAREELAELYASLGRRGDELEQLQVIAGLDRDRLESQIAVGLAHARWSADPQETPSRRAGHEDLAVLTLGSALERNPDQPLVYAALGRVWLDIAQARDDGVALNKALEALERAGSTSAATSETLTLYGRALLQSGRVDVGRTHPPAGHRALPARADGVPLLRDGGGTGESSRGRQTSADSVRRPRGRRSRLRDTRGEDCGALAAAR